MECRLSRSSRRVVWGDALPLGARRSGALVLRSTLLCGLTLPDPLLVFLDDRVRLGRARQETPDQDLVKAGADEAADERCDDGHPEVQLAVLVAEGGSVAGDERGEPGAEVARRIDRVARVRA